MMGKVVRKKSILIYAHVFTYLYVYIFIYAFMYLFVLKGLVGLWQCVILVSWPGI